MKILKDILQEMKNSLFSKRGLSFWFILAAFVFSVITLIVYNATGVTSYTPSLSGKVIALLCVGAVLGVLFSICEIKVGKYAVYLITFWAWLEYLISQASYLSSIMVAIDNVAINTGFVLTTVFGLLAWVAALVSAILQKKEIGSLNSKPVAVKAEK